MSHQIEIGNPAYIAGKNGCEVAREVIESCSDIKVPSEDIMYLDKSREYWIGWSLAYYQWMTKESFCEIDEYMPVEGLYGMYETLHEADISLFVEIMSKKRTEMRKDSTLKRLRQYADLSQKKLAEKAGVPLRQIQLFEQGQRDISKTQAITLYKLSLALGCRMEDLIGK